MQHSPHALVLALLGAYRFLFPPDVPITGPATAFSIFAASGLVWRHPVRKRVIPLAPTRPGAGRVGRLLQTFDAVARLRTWLKIERDSSPIRSQPVEEFLDACPVAIYRANATPCYHVSFISANVSDIFGYVSDEFLATPDFWSARVHPDDAPELFAALDGVGASSRLTLEYRFRHRNGTYRWTRDDLRVVRGLTGAPTEIVGAWSDITDARLAEDAERARRAQRAQRRSTLEAILASMSDGLLVLDPDGCLSRVNRQAEELLGLPLQRYVGQQLQTVFEAHKRIMASPDTLWADLQAALTRVEELPTLELTVVGAQNRDLLVQFFPLSLADSLRGAGLLLHDVTRERELALVKDELVATVSHELRTPLASLVGFAELLLTRPYDDEQRHQFLTIMYDEGQRLTKLLSDFLDLQRAENREVELDASPQALPALVERTLAAIGDDPEHPCVVDVPPSLPLVQVDPTCMQQILLNLVSNARKYSPAGGDVRISARAVDGAVEIAIEDQGLGIPPEALPRLFNRYYRVASADRHQIRGSGLGLAICKRLVEAHRGSITAESLGPGQGSTFRVRVPVSTEANNVAVETAILVVDDDPSSRDLLRIHVERAGYRAAEANGPDQGLAALAEDPTIRLVLSDFHMPTREDGLRFIRTVRRRWPKLPLVVVTAYPDDLRDLLGATDGPHLVVPKPVQRQGIEEALRLLRFPADPR